MNWTNFINERCNRDLNWSRSLLFCTVNKISYKRCKTWVGFAEGMCEYEDLSCGIICALRNPKVELMFLLTLLYMFLMMMVMIFFYGLTKPKFLQLIIGWKNFFQLAQFIPPEGERLWCAGASTNYTGYYVTQASQIIKLQRAL